MGKVFICDNIENKINAFKECAKTLDNGGLAVFPTATVYGIGADAYNENAIRSLYEKKQRPLDKPLLMHISSLEMAEEIAYLNDTAREFIKRLTPGPLTEVVKAKPILPSIALAGGDTVGLRFPSNDIFLEISKAFGKPIAATSANISGEKSTARAEELKSITDVADVIIGGGECELGLESTIVSLTGEKANILRLGSFPKERIAEVIECD